MSFSLDLEDVGVMERINPALFPSSSGYQRCVFTELAPRVYLVAAIQIPENQCVVELVIHPEIQRAMESTDTSSFTAETMPFLLKMQNLFRVPKVIPIMEEEEGVLTTVEMIRDPNGQLPVHLDYRSSKGTSSSSPLAQRSSTQSPQGKSSPAKPVASFSSTRDAILADTSNPPFVFLFLGTSNGTILVCNALRGTILTAAQFRMAPRDLRQNVPQTQSSISSQIAKTVLRRRQDGSNEDSNSVVRFIPHVVTSAVRHNPNLLDVLSKTEYAPLLSSSSGNSASEVQGQDAAGQKKTPPGTETTQQDVRGAQSTQEVKLVSVLSCVYVLHSDGYTVPLPRAALDIFMEVAQAKLDGHRPHLSYEWVSSSSPSPFPVAGPAAHFSQRLATYFKLKWGEYTRAETDMAVEVPSVCDGAFAYRIHNETEDLLAAEDHFEQTLLLAGASPALSVYKLNPSHQPYTTARMVKEAASMIKGAAVGLVKELWGTIAWADRTASISSGLRGPVEKNPPLQKVSLVPDTDIFGGDMVFSRVEVDPTQQHAACFCTSGRLYMYDIVSGIVWRVMKGCRSATCQWFFVDVFGRRTLMVAVYLPLRSVLEIYSVRLRERVTACTLPASTALFLRPDVSLGSVTLLLVLTDGSVKRVSLRIDSTARAALPVDVSLNTDTIVASKTAVGSSSSVGSPTSRTTGTTLDGADTAGKTQLASPVSSGKRFTGQTSLELLSRLKARLRLCRKPDDYIELAVQLILTHMDTESICQLRNSFTLITSTLKERLAPGMSVNRVIPKRAGAMRFNIASEESRCSENAFPPCGLTSAQALNFIELYQTAVETYARLIMDDQNGGSPSPSSSSLMGTLPRTLSFSQKSQRTGTTAQDATLSGVLRGVSASLVALLGQDTTAVRQFLTEFELYQNTSDGRAPVASGRVKGTADQKPDAPGVANSGSARQSTAEIKTGTLPFPRGFGMKMLGIDAFLSFFYFGGYKLELLMDDIIEDSIRSHMPIAAQFGDLIFKRDGLDAFMGKLEVFSLLGFHSTETMFITFSWMIVSFTRDPAAFLASNTTESINVVVKNCSDDCFVQTMERVLLPFSPSHNWIAAERSLSMFIAVMLVRWRQRPVHEATLPAYTLLLRQALHLRAAVKRAADDTLVTRTSKPSSVDSSQITLRRHASLLGHSSQDTIWQLSFASILPRGSEITTAKAMQGSPRSTDRESQSRPSSGSGTVGAKVGDGSRQLAGCNTQPEALAWQLFKNCNVHAAALLACHLTPTPVPLVYVELYKVLQCRSDSEAFDKTLPWNVRGTWDSDLFRTTVITPLSSIGGMMERVSPSSSSSATGLQGRMPRRSNSDLGFADSPALGDATRFSFNSRSGSVDEAHWFSTAVVMVATLRIAEREVRSLRRAMRFYFDNGSIPSIDLFIPLPPPAKDYIKGSRSSKEYLSSCRELLSFASINADKLLYDSSPADMQRKCAAVVAAIDSGFDQDNGLLFPHLGDSAIRALLTQLKVSLKTSVAAAECVLEEVNDALSLMDVILFFTITLPQSGVPLAKCIPRWQSMYDSDVMCLTTVLSKQPEATPSSSSPSSSSPPVTNQAPDAAYYLSRQNHRNDKLQERAAFLRQFVEDNLTTNAAMSVPGAALDRLVKSLCDALHLSSVIPDLTQIVLFDLAAKRLTNPQAVERYVVTLASRHLAAGVALYKLRTFLGCVLKYYYGLKQLIPHENKAEMQRYSLRFRKMREVFSDDCRHWIQRLQASNPQDGEKATNTTKQTSGSPAPGGADEDLAVVSPAAAQESGSPGSPTKSSSHEMHVRSLEQSVLRSVCSVSPTDFLIMDRLVQQRLSMGPGRDRDEFMDILLQLANIAADGAQYLEPKELRIFATDMPSVIQRLRELLW